jgi:hypothetical protein
MYILQWFLGCHMWMHTVRGGRGVSSNLSMEMHHERHDDCILTSRGSILFRMLQHNTVHAQHWRMIGTFLMVSNQLTRMKWVKQSFVRNNVSACFIKHVYHNMFRLKSKPSSGVTPWLIKHAETLLRTKDCCTHFIVTCATGCTHPI